MILRMKIGYARVSPNAQHLGLQRVVLEAAGCEISYQDEGISGLVIERDGLTQALRALGTGDMLVIWEIDRLGCSLGA
jgi:DNA invertase Pin-like site-specific DNA recombinase